MCAPFSRTIKNTTGTWIYLCVRDVGLHNSWYHLHHCCSRYRHISVSSIISHSYPFQLVVDKDKEKLTFMAQTHGGWQPCWTMLIITSLCSNDAPGLHMEQSVRQEVSREQRMWIIFTIENPVKCTKLLVEELTIKEQWQKTPSQIEACDHRAAAILGNKMNPVFYTVKCNGSTFNTGCTEPFKTASYKTVMMLTWVFVSFYRELVPSQNEDGSR